MIREDTIMDTVDGQVRTYCSKTCHWTDKEVFRSSYQGRETPAMGRLVASANGKPAIMAGTWLMS